MMAIGKDNGEEMFPIVTETGEIVGAASRAECHGGLKLLHPVVHLHIFNSRGELYLQKRPEWKDIQPGRWDTAVGGHIDLGECVEDALHREASEEVGITFEKAEPLTPYVFESDRERELVNPFRIIYDGALHPSEETAGGRFWSRQELLEAMGKEVLTPNFEQEYERLLKE